MRTDKAKILVVDDEPDIANSLKSGLEHRGYVVEAYTEPQKALENYKVGQYNLCILDIKMPKMNGFQLYVEIKKLEHNVKICFCTAFEAEYRDEFHKAFPELDTKSFITKPATLSQLVTRIDQELKKEMTVL
ncbi:MAG TPA: response regulator [Candidatus Nitrosotalea sp.]|nr:response regulator [Candidatus Nitrosotalea sp.]